MLNQIRYECAPLLNESSPWWESEIHALPVPYEKLTKYSRGLEFRSDQPGNSRGVLYDRREDIQAQFKLYFSAYDGGIRFTMLPKLGMLWRFEQEQRQTQRALEKTTSMTQEAIKASGAMVEAALFQAIAEQYDKVMERAGRLRRMTETLLERPESPTLLPPRE